jgi:hypothetical protein
MARLARMNKNVEIVPEKFGELMDFPVICN